MTLSVTLTVRRLLPVRYSTAVMVTASAIGLTVTVVVAWATRFPVFLTTRPNVMTAGWLPAATVGAVNVGLGVFAPVRVTLGPAVLVQV